MILFCLKRQLVHLKDVRSKLSQNLQHNRVGPINLTQAKVLPLIGQVANHI